jgi:sulfonate transport system permease protein
MWGAGGLLILLTIWQIIAASGFVSTAFLPRPFAAFSAFGAGIVDGTLLSRLLDTTVRMLEGWLLAGLIGIALGTLIALSASARAYLQPTLEFLRPLPAPALVPLAIGLLGLGPQMVLAVIVFGSLWPPMLATISGVTMVEPRLVEVGRMLQLSRTAFLMKIGLRSAAADIVAGLRVSLSIALILSVLGEMLAGQEGLGELILLAARSFRAQDLYAAILMLSLLGMALNAALRSVERLIRNDVDDATIDSI